jgi:hypothetical protein
VIQPRGQESDPAEGSVLHFTDTPRPAEGSVLHFTDTPRPAEGSVLHFTDTPRPKTDATERVPPWLNPMEGHGPSWPQIRLIAKLAIEVPLVEVQSWSTFADLGAEVREVANIIAAEFEKLCVVDDPIAVNQVVSQVGKLAQFVCQGRADQAMLPCF